MYNTQSEFLNFVKHMIFFDKTKSQEKTREKKPLLSPLLEGSIITANGCKHHTFR